MATGEFDIIERYFARASQRKDVIIGIGDDAAVLTPFEGGQLVVTTDTLVAGTHFLEDINPADLAYKAVVVNLSDLAAMGAEPAWMTLAITLPDVDEAWLDGFAASLHNVCQYYGVALIGGDTTKGPLSITITMHGQVPRERALTRADARVGDWIYVTGTLGDSAAGLKCLTGELNPEEWHREYLVERHLKPKPKLLAGRALRDRANAMMDLSDGLASDLQKILTLSGVGAQIDIESLPLSPALRASVTADEALKMALSGGEDYELLFTVPESEKGALPTTLTESGVEHCCIGQITAGSGIVFRREGAPVPLDYQGYDHFRS